MPTKRSRMPVKGRLVTLSNRLPITLRGGPQGMTRVRSSGGLVAAFEPLLGRMGGIWLGYPGPYLPKGMSLTEPGDPYQIRPVRIPPADFDAYYHGLSNRALWPLFHTLPGQATFQSADWRAYEVVNGLFTKAAASILERDDIILVNDYHLMRVPRRLRRRKPAATIGFFLHIPFPPYDVFRVFPWARPLLRGLLACDLIGFHVPGYVRNFLDCAMRLLDLRVHRRSGTVEFEGRTVRVAALPLGIDYEYFDTMAHSAPPSGFTKKEKMILGVDRLDYTKGIPERLLAFERLLENYRTAREKVTMVQLAVPSRAEVDEYRALKRQIDELVGRINGRFATHSWTPIRYLYQSVSQEELAGLYRDADVCLVTPLRDGMNLVAKEYVACQVDEPGVLVLSHMAGAAETMHESLLVNPYNVEDTAQKLYRALNMTERERRSRMERLRKREASSNVHVWAEKLIASVAEAARQNAGVRPFRAETARPRRPRPAKPERPAKTDRPATSEAGG